MPDRSRNKGGARDSIAQGHALMSGDAAGALIEYEAALSLDPSNGEALMSAALALAQLGRRGEAVERLKVASEAREWDARGLLYLAEGLRVLGEAAEARQLASRATESRSEDWSGEASLATDVARLWMLLGDARRALEVLDSVGLAAAGSARVHWVRGRCLAQLGQHQQALVEYEASMALEPEQPQGLLDTALVLHDLGRTDEALEHARRARQAVSGLDAWGGIGLVDLLAELGAESEARAALEELTTATLETGARKASAAMARCWRRLGEPAQAASVLDQLLADPSWAASAEANEAIRLRAVSRLAAGDPAASVLDFEALEARGARVTEPDDRAQAGFAYRLLNRFEAALPYLDGIADSVSQGLRAPVLLNTGIALVGRGDHEEAMAPLRTAFTLAGSPGGERSFQGSAALFLALAYAGDPSQQMHWLEEADRLLPSDHENRSVLDLVRADRAAADRRWDDVLALTNGLPERVAPSNRCQVWRLRGRALAEEGSFDEALTVLDLAVASSDAPASELGQARWLRGLVHRARGDHANARLDFVGARALIDDAEPQRELAILVASCESRLGNNEAARMALDQLADDDPGMADDPRYWDVRVGVLLGLGSTDEAIVAFGRLAELDPSKKPFWPLVQAGAGLLRDDWSEQEDALRQLDTPADDADAMQWLFAALARVTQGPAAAGEALSRATELNAALADSDLGRLARMLIASSQGDRVAFDAAARAEEADPAMRSLVHLMRGQLLARVGDDSPAIGELEAAARVAAHHPGPYTDRQAVVALARKAQLHLKLEEVDAARAAVTDARRLVARLREPPVLRALLTITYAAVRLRAEGVDRALDELARLGVDREPLPTNLRGVLEAVRGTFLRLAGDDEAALAALTLAAELDPTDTRTLRTLTEVQIVLGDADAALVTIEKALPIAQEVSEQKTFLRLRSIALRRSGQLEPSLESGRLAVRLDSGDSQAWLTLADAYQELDRLGPAANAFRRAWDLSRNTDATAARTFVGLTRALILAGKGRAALEAFDSPDRRRQLSELAKTYGAISFNRGVALLQCGDEEQALRELRAAADAHHPPPQAAELAGRLVRSLASRSSWLGFWFLEGGGGRRLAGSSLLVMLTVGMFIAIANPTEFSWIDWVSTDGNHRLVPAVVITTLFLLPVVSRFKFGGIEVEQPQPAAADVPEIQPTTLDDVLEELNAVTTAMTKAVTRAITPVTGSSE